MATISNTPRPGFIYDSTDGVWYPIGTGTHSHSEIAKTIVDAKGDLIVGTAADTVARQAVGTDGQMLYADSTQTNGIKWADAPSSGGMTLLATATPSAATSISFTSISQDYKHLFLIWRDCYSPSGFGTGYWAARLNNDSGTNYRGSGSNNAGGFSSISTSATSFGTAAGNSPIGGTSDTSMGQYVANGSMWIYDYTNGDKVNVFYTTSGENTTQGFANHFNGVYDGSAAITQLDFIRSSTNTLTGTIKLYGVK